MMNKRAVSPVIATIFLILLALVLSVLLYSFLRGFIQEGITKEGKPIESLCFEVNIQVDLTPINSISSELTITNLGNINLAQVEVQKIGKIGSKIQDPPFGPLSAGSSNKITLDLESGYNEKIKIIPVLAGSKGGKIVNYRCPDSSAKTLEI